VRLRLTVEWAHEAQGNSRFGRRRSNRFTINIGKDHLRDLSVGGAISYSVFEPLANERSSCVKQLLDYLRSRSAGRSQGRLSGRATKRLVLGRSHQTSPTMQVGSWAMNGSGWSRRS
jgi:hypothetical protein